MAEFSSQTLRRLQMTELEILKVLDAFCKEHQITYFIDSGTLLGAVRHAGFIPWDDDMDCGMLRQDYDRFAELAEEGLPDGYSLHTAKNTPGFAGTFAKIYKDGTRFETKETQEAGCPQGIFVDVFPYDTLAADPKERARQMAECGRAQKLLYLHASKSITVPFKGALGAIAKAGCRAAHYAVRAATTNEKLLADFDRAWHFEGEASQDTCIMCYPEGGVFPKSMLVPTKTVWFEGVELPCPADAQGYLTTLYGQTWSQLPPEEDRRTHMPVVLDFGD